MKKNGLLTAQDPANNGLTRRQMMMAAGGLGLTVASSSALLGCPPGEEPNLDVDILNFALNLEYLEAEFYLQAFGESLTAAERGPNAGTVTGGSPVTFANATFEAYAREIADNEREHVNFLRDQLGAAAVSMPDINLSTSFDAAAQAAGIGQTFDPYANDLNFFTGAFIFEDVGVTAYKGAAPLITSQAYLSAAAGILAVEAYHAATIRTSIWNTGAAGFTVDLGLPLKAHATNANAISDARDSLDGASDLDQGLAIDDVVNIVPADANGIAFGRTVSQVLRIVYLTAEQGVTGGGFFPNGVNGSAAFSTT